MTEDMLDKIVFLLLGWLLGLVGPIVVDGIRRKRENALGRAAILTELTELAVTLSTAAYGVRMSLGTVDRQFLESLKIFLEQHEVTTQQQKFVSHLRTQLSWTDEELKKVARYMSADEGKGSMLQYYPVPLLDARVSALWSFDTSFQRKLLEIRRNVAILDDVVNRSRKYFDMTFTKLEGDNYQLVADNLNQTYALYAERAMIIVDLVKSLK